MLFDIIQINYACVIVCVLFIVFVVTDRSFEATVERMFLITSAIVLCLCTVDSLELVQAQLTEPTLLRRIYSAVGYTLRPAVAIMPIFILHRNKFSPNIRLHLSLMLVPFFLNALLCLSSIFTGWVFDYTADNIFVRGPLGLLPFFTAGLYIVGMVAVTLLNIRTRRRGETFVVFMIAVLCALGTLMESLFQFDGTLNTSCAISTVFYYLYLHVSVYSSDQLTGAFNRRIFYLDVEKLRGDAVIVELDLNDLKHINDTNGHAAGDAALTTLVNTVQKRLRRECTLYRTGGDEFAMICKNMAVEDVERMLRAISEAMSATPYTFAYGCTPYRANEDIDAVCGDADSRMYDMKAKMKTGGN